MASREEREAAKGSCSRITDLRVLRTCGAQAPGVPPIALRGSHLAVLKLATLALRVRFWYRGGTVSREAAKVMSDFRFRWQQVL